MATQLLLDNLPRRPLVMGVVNVTPDSFSDGGKFLSPDAALKHAHRLAEEGADILDVGGESTRPGAEPVSADDELKRVIPVVEAVTREIGLPVSVDTGKPEVMLAAAEAGAAMLNDVTGLRAPGGLKAAAASGLPICIMHMLGEPRTMQKNPVYQDVVKDISSFLSERVEACKAAGIDHSRIILDPGFGFGKTLAHNLELLRRFDELNTLGFPLLAGVSRKTTLGKITGRENPAERVAASVAAAVLLAQKGVRIIRVHDVAETVDALRVWNAVMTSP